MKLPFGHWQGQYVHISEVTSGRTDVLCPYCQQGLIAKKGKIKRHHFAHDSKPCTQYYANRFFGLTGKLPTKLALSVYAQQKKASINQFYKKLLEQQQKFTNKDQKEKVILPQLKQDLQKLAVDNNQLIPEILQQIDRFLNQKIAPFPDFHLLRRAQFIEGYTDGKNYCAANEINQDQYEFYYPMAFKKYVQFLKNYHSESYDFSEINSKIQLFQKDLAYFRKFTLYFLEVRIDHQKIYKIGLTSRPIIQRKKEITQDLKNHYLQIDLKLLFQQENVAFLETFFKQKYAAQQFKIGQLTEYFSFSESEIVLLLKDLTLLAYKGMPPRTSPDWIVWVFFNFNGKIYGHSQKSVYVKEERFLLTDLEAKGLLQLTCQD